MRSTRHLSIKVERRLAFIEERLFWLGEINRTDLVDRFGVSLSQASADIARYLARAPRGVFYDKSAKRYAAGDDFRPVLAKPDATRLLGELRLVDAGILAAEDTMLGSASPFDATPVPARPVDPYALRIVVRAIRERRVVAASYQSMSRPQPAPRIIEPHALAHDGFRWHARAFDRETGEFRDFVLGRLSKPKLGEGLGEKVGEKLDGNAGADAGPSPADDADWHAFVTLVIAPHPGLTPAQAQAIALDYGIRGATAAIKVRRALLLYALRRLGLDVPPEARPPHVQHIVLINRDEIERALVKRNET